MITIIKMIMEEKGIDVDELHKKTEIQKKYLEKYMDNTIKRINIYAILKIADVLKINFKDLVFTTYDLDSLKKRMYYNMEKYGFTYPEVQKLSKIIDLLITEDAKNQKIGLKDLNSKNADI